MTLESWGLGGTERYVERLCQFLSVSGAAHVSLALLSTPDRHTMEGVEPFVRDCHILDGGGYHSLGKLRRLVRQHAFDVVHMHLYSSLLPSTMIVRTASAIPTLATLHMPLTPWSLRHRVAWRLAVRMTNRVVANSRAVADSLGRIAATTEVIAGCIDAPQMECTPRSDDTFRIVGVGRLSREKSFETLIEAIAQVRENSPRAISCRIIGDGAEREPLRSLARQQGVADILELPGSMPHEDVSRELAGSDLFVLPSRFEGLGLAPLEAMAAGVPTITSDFPAAREFIDHNHTGHRFPIGDAEQLAGLICWHRDQPDESAAIGQCGRAAVLEQFSEENTVARYADIYTQLTAGRYQEVGR